MNCGILLLHVFGWMTVASLRASVNFPIEIVTGKPHSLYKCQQHLNTCLWLCWSLDSSEWCNYGEICLQKYFRLLVDTTIISFNWSRNLRMTVNCRCLVKMQELYEDEMYCNIHVDVTLEVYCSFVESMIN